MNTKKLIQYNIESNFMNSSNSIRPIPEKPKLVRQTNLDNINMNLHTNYIHNAKDIFKYLDDYGSNTLCVPSNTLLSQKNIKK